MQNWDDYRIILALRRERTLRGAAETLGVTHTTVSRRLAFLDQQFGHPLFEKIVGGYRATSIGQDLANIAEQMESIDYASERKKRAAATDLTGAITLSIPEMIGQYLLADDLVDYARMYPNIELTVLSSTTFADLDRSEADIVIRGTNDPSSHLVGRRLFPYALSYYARTGYLEQTQPEDLCWITAPTGNDAPDWIALSPFPNAPIGLRLSDIALRHLAVIAGFGMAISACFMADPEPTLVRLPGAVPVPRHDLWVLTHPDLRHSPKIKTTLNFLADRLSDKRDLIEGNI